MNLPFDPFYHIMVASVVYTLSLSYGVFTPYSAHLSSPNRVTSLFLCSTPTCQLSVHRLRPHQPSGYAGWEGLLTALDLPPYTSPRSVLKHVVCLLEKGG